MATATQTAPAPPGGRHDDAARASLGVVVAAPARSLDPERVDRADRSVYRCDCGHALRVFGGGRHRVYFELDTARLDDPVMNRVCPGCWHALPGKTGRDCGARRPPPAFCLSVDQRQPELRPDSYDF